jgi:hypothetical protein
MAYNPQASLFFSFLLMIRLVLSTQKHVLNLRLSLTVVNGEEEIDWRAEARQPSSN